MQDQGVFLDWLLAVIATTLFAVYHGYLMLRIRRRPLSTVIGVNHETRARWIQAILQRLEGLDGLLAIQTLRNNIMAASLLASTAVLLASTLAGFAASADTWTGLDNIVFGWTRPPASPLDSSASTSPSSAVARLLAIKFLTLILTLLISFFCYSQAIRLYNHACILLSLPRSVLAGLPMSPSDNQHVSQPYDQDGPQLQLCGIYVTRVLARASNFYTIGTRFYYLAMLFLLWLFGPIFLLVACVLLILGFFFLDHVVLPGKGSTQYVTAANHLTGI